MHYIYVKWNKQKKKMWVFLHGKTEVELLLILLSNLLELKYETECFYEIYFSCRMEVVTNGIWFEEIRISTKNEIKSGERRI